MAFDIIENANGAQNDRKVVFAFVNDRVTVSRDLSVEEAAEYWGLYIWHVIREERKAHPEEDPATVAKRVFREFETSSLAVRLFVDAGLFEEVASDEGGEDNQ